MMANDKIKDHLFEEYIDTETAEQNFEILLKQNKTFFLNGAWGSGKTEFIEKVKKRSINRKFGEKKDLVILDLWRNDNASIFTNAFRLLSLKWFMFTRLAVAGILCSFILMSGIIKVPEEIIQSLSSTVIVLLLKNVVLFMLIVGPSMFILMPNTLLLIPYEKALFQYTKELLPYMKGIFTFIDLLLIILILLTAVAVAISKHLGLKISLLDYIMLDRISLKGKVLVVDDFDRLTLKQQKEGYKLFTFLKNRLPIVFLGDYKRLADQLDENYLIKVIDKRIELPYILHPVNIWYPYFKFLENDLDVSISEEIKNLFKNESRNLRDRAQFQSYVYQEFYTNDKKNRVQVSDQLLIIYLYLFYEEKYQLLRNGVDIEYKKDEKGNQIYTSIDDLAILMQRNINMEYPPRFAQNREGYFIFESVLNASVTELKSIMDDEATLTEQFEVSYSISENDFIRYVRTHQTEFTPEESEMLLNLALDYFKKTGHNSALTRIVIYQKSNQILPFKIPRGQGIFDIPEEIQGKTEEEITEIYFKEWSGLLEKKSFEYSEKVRFFRENYLVSYSKLASEYEDLDTVIEKILSFVYPEEMLSIYLASKNQWYEFTSWSEDVWNAIRELPEISFKNFCSIQNIQSTRISVPYSLSKGNRSVDDLYETQDNSEFLEKMQSKIKEFGIKIDD